MIFINVEIHLVANSIIPIQRSITIARSHMVENFPRILCTMEKFLKVPLKTEEDHVSKKIKQKMRLKSNQ